MNKWYYRKIFVIIVRGMRGLSVWNSLRRPQLNNPLGALWAQNGLLITEF